MLHSHSIIMRVFISGVKGVDGLHETRACLLLVLVLICSIDRSNSRDTPAKTTTGSLLLQPPSSLTPPQLKSAVTIEFNFSDIDKQNSLAVYVEVRRKIKDYLNRRKMRKSTTDLIYPTTIGLKSTTTAEDATPIIATPIITTPSTTTVTITTTSITTPTTPATTPAVGLGLLTTVVETTTAERLTTAVPTDATSQDASLNKPTVRPYRKRKKRDNGEYDETFTEENLPFIDIEPEFDENGNLRITLFINETGLGDLSHLEPDPKDLDLGQLLYEIGIELNKTGELEAAANAPVVNIYKGLPAPKAIIIVQGANVADCLSWLLLILLIVSLVIIFMACWKLLKDDERTKRTKKIDLKPLILDDNCGWIVPYEFKSVILDDNCGWIVPCEQFGNEQS